MKFFVSRSNLNGTTRIPGNKSATARGIILGGLAAGKSVLHNPLPGIDSFSIVEMMRALGAHIDTSSNDAWLFTGVDNKPQVPSGILDAGNSGTGAYMLMAVAALLDGCAVVSGDYQICRRPAGPEMEALNAMGARVESTRNNGLFPAVVKGKLLGGEFEFPKVNSQWMTPIMLAAALSPKGMVGYSKGMMEIPYIEMTMGWMKIAGVESSHENHEVFRVPGNQSYKAFEAEIPADWGSSGYPMVAAAITDSDLTFTGMKFNDYAGERAYPFIIRDMGGDVTMDEAAGTVRIKGGKQLHGIEIDCADKPDAVPALAALGCRAKGKTVLRNVGASRLKETDRTRSIKEELTKMGGKFEETEDTLTIYESNLHGAMIDGRHDHRIVMASSVAALTATGETIVDHAEWSAVSFPGFYELMRKLGAKIERLDYV